MPPSGSSSATSPGAAAKRSTRMTSRSRWSPSVHHYQPYKKNNGSSSSAHMPLSHSSQVKPSSANESAYAWAENLASMPIILGQDHAGRQMATAAAWKDLLPKLVYPYMEWQEGKAQSKLPNKESIGSKSIGYCWLRLKSF